MKNSSFSDQLIHWYHKHGRRTLPWQHPKTAYRVWISEIMLQQTQVKTVIPYFERFMQRFPDIASLAQAQLDDVLAIWSGLGYYSRARYLHKAAQMIQQNFQGRFPDQLESILSLPGIGASTAGAILSFCFKQAQPILDGNVKRILARLYEIPTPTNASTTLKQLWQLATELTPKTNTADYTQAIMDLGATLCTRSKPKCTQCPVSGFCQAYKNQSVEQFPVKTIKKAKPTKQRLFIIPMQDQHILMHKRPPSGIWGGLWSFIELPIEQEAEVSPYLQKRFKIKTNSLNTLEKIQHIFTHYKLIATPIVANISSPKTRANPFIDHQWISIDVLPTMGLAAPVKQLLTTLL